MMEGFFRLAGLNEEPSFFKRGYLQHLHILGL